jgi:hypothetical protein
MPVDMFELEDDSAAVASLVSEGAERITRAALPVDAGLTNNL